MKPGSAVPHRCAGHTWDHHVSADPSGHIRREFTEKTQLYRQPTLKHSGGRVSAFLDRLTVGRFQPRQREVCRARLAKSDRLVGFWRFPPCVELHLTWCVRSTFTSVRRCGGRFETSAMSFFTTARGVRNTRFGTSSTGKPLFNRKQ